MIRFEVRLGSDWTPVTQGIILGDGKRLAWWIDSRKGISPLGSWRLAPSTIRHPTFKAALWDGLSEEEKLQAITRRTGVVKLAG